MRVKGRNQNLESINCRPFIKDELPFGYSKREWVKFSYVPANGQTTHVLSNSLPIDTGYIPNLNTVIIGAFEHTEHEIDTPLFGVRNSADSDADSYIFWAHPSDYTASPFNTVFFGGDSVNFSGSGLPSGTKETFSYSQESVTCNNETKFFSGERTNARNSLMLCGLKNDSSIDSRHFAGKIYYFKIYENGVLVRNYIPYYKSDVNDDWGLYETVLGTTHSFAGMVVQTIKPNILFSEYIGPEIKKLRFSPKIPANITYITYDDTTLVDGPSRVALGGETETIYAASANNNYGLSVTEGIESIRTVPNNFIINGHSSSGEHVFNYNGTGIASKETYRFNLKPTVGAPLNIPVHVYAYRQYPDITFTQPYLETSEITDGSFPTTAAYIFEANYDFDYNTLYSAMKKTCIPNEHSCTPIKVRLPVGKKFSNYESPISMNCSGETPSITWHYCIPQNRVSRSGTYGNGTRYWDRISGGLEYDIILTCNLATPIQQRYFTDIKECSTSNITFTVNTPVTDVSSSDIEGIWVFNTTLNKPMGWDGRLSFDFDTIYLGKNNEILFKHNKALCINSTYVDAKYTDSFMLWYATSDSDAGITDIPNSATKVYSDSTNWITSKDYSNPKLITVTHVEPEYAALVLAFLEQNATKQ